MTTDKSPKENIPAKDPELTAPAQPNAGKPLIYCDICKQPYGHFIRDPLTHAMVHVQCNSGVTINDRRYKPGGFRV